MNFAKEMLIRILENEQIKVKISISKKDYAKMFADGCYVALSQIREIIKDDKLSDYQCIERIIGIFERLGTDCGSRHSEVK